MGPSALYPVNIIFSRAVNRRQAQCSYTLSVFICSLNASHSDRPSVRATHFGPPVSRSSSSGFSHPERGVRRGERVSGPVHLPDRQHPGPPRRRPAAVHAGLLRLHPAGSQRGSVSVLGRFPPRQRVRVLQINSTPPSADLSLICICKTDNITEISDDQMDLKATAT